MYLVFTALKKNELFLNRKPRIYVHSADKIQKRFEFSILYLKKGNFFAKN